jgi:hypothetical protein
MNAVAFGIAVVLLSSAAAADIFEWRDTDGVAHYTNLQADVPQEQPPSLHVVVDERAREVQGKTEPGCEPAAAVAQPAPLPEMRRQAQAVYDQSAVVTAYIAGVERGLAAAREDAAAKDPDGGIFIHGPLAVANARSTPPYYGYPYYGYAPYAFPLLTTPFDRGRSRFLTIRQLLDDELQFERDWPFIYPPVLVRPGLATPVVSVTLPQRLVGQMRVVTR